MTNRANQNWPVDEVTEIREPRQALRNFRNWFADHFEQFDDATNMQLLCLDNEAAFALGEE